MTACMSCSMPTMVGGGRSAKQTKTKDDKKCTKCKEACTCNCKCKVKGACKKSGGKSTNKKK